MEKTPIKIVRYLLGALLLFGGLNKFFHFAPVEHAAEAGAFMHAMVETGYFMPFIGIVEVALGALLLAGVFVPLSLVVLAPLSVNIVLFHAFLDPAGIGGAAVIATFNLILGVANLSKFQDILMPR